MYINVKYSCIIVVTTSTRVTGYFQLVHRLDIQVAVTTKVISQ